MTPNRQFFDGRAREGGERVDDVLDGKEGRQMDLPELFEWGLLWLFKGKGFRGDGGVEGERVDGVADVAHDTLSADTVEVLGLVVAATEIKEFEGTTDGGGGPHGVTEMGVADAKLFEGGKTEKGRQ